MARFFAIIAPPPGLDDLDRWGTLDSLPASLDSQLWISAGLWGLEAEEFARCAQSIAGRVIVSLGGKLRAASSGGLRSSVVLLADMEEGANSGSTLKALRLRPIRAVSEARTGGSCLGVGVLYLEAGGAAASGSSLLLPRKLALGGSGGAAGIGALSLHFVHLLTLGLEGQGGSESPACSGGTLALGFKGWDWEQRGQGGEASFWQEAARPSSEWESSGEAEPQGWEQEHNPSIFWKEKETRKTAWL